jgi:hypothetical protein
VCPEPREAWVKGKRAKRNAAAVARLMEISDLTHSPGLMVPDGFVSFTLF